jgi:hypothetical protein
MKIPIYRATKLELTKAGQELEKRGWECVGKITPVRKVTKNYNYHDNKIGLKNQYSSTNDHIVYRAVYEKE